MARRQVKSGSFMKIRFDAINKTLLRFEGELEKSMKRLIGAGGQSTQELRRRFDEVLDWLKNGEIYTVAASTRENIDVELKRLKKETLDRLDEKLGELKSISTPELFSGLRLSVLGLLEKVQDVAIVEEVKEKAALGKRELFRVLDVPSQTELDQLSNKVVRLERRVSTILKKAA